MRDAAKRDIIMHGRTASDTGLRGMLPKLAGDADLEEWSHPPESNRRPTDYELSRGAY